MSTTEHLATMTTREYEEILRRVDHSSNADLISRDQDRTGAAIDYLWMTSETLEAEAKELRELIKSLEDRADAIENEAESVSDTMELLRGLGNYDPRDGGREAIRLFAEATGMRLP